MTAGEISAGFYPERDVLPPDSAADRAWLSSVFWAHQLLHRRMRDPGAFAVQVALHADRMRGRSLASAVPAQRYRLRRAPLSDDLLAECFGLYCAALERGAEHEQAPTPQMLGAARALVKGGIVELAGAADRQGTLALAAAAMALRGTPVHVLAASAPRAERLAGRLRPPLEALGIGVGYIAPAADGPARRQAYASLVVCGALRDVGFDYLRDRIALGGRPRRVLGTLERLSGDARAERGLFLPGMRCALVDDAEQVMLDDSRAPLTVSTDAEQSAERLTYQQALELARALREGADFTLGAERTQLAPQASRRIARLTQALGGIWASRERREALITLALDALHILRRDRDYRVASGRVAFAPGPADDDGEPDATEQLLRRLVEVKEGCRLGGPRRVLAQMGVPRMLGRYLHLAGVCGDARGLEREFWRLYGVKTVLAGEYARPVPWGARLYATAAGKRSALLECARATAAGEGAVVIALRSPAEAQALLEAFAEAGIAPGFVRGTGDAAEQQAVARLDSPGAVLVSLHPGERCVARAPSAAVRLRLVVAELHDAQRHLEHIGRAYGASACEFVLSLEDEALKAHLGPRALAAAARAGRARGELAPDAARGWVKRALRGAASASAQARRDAHQADRNLDDLLAFSGVRE